MNRDLHFRTLEEQLVRESAALLEFFAEASVTDILIQGSHRAYIERSGKLLEVTNPFLSRDAIERFIERLTLPTGRGIDARSPYLDGNLVDGSRFHLVLPPIAVNGPYICIRKLKAIQGVGLASFGPEGVIASILESVRLGENLLISGGTGAGKTTFLNLMIRSLPTEIRWVVVEETREIEIPDPHHVVFLEARPPSPDGVGEVTLRTLIRNSLRMRPDRIVLGECRGEEAFDMLQAMSTGHGGSMGTIHANGALDALHRFEALVQLSGIAMEPVALRLWISRAVHRVVHLERSKSGRTVVESLRVTGVESDRYRIFPEYQIDRSGVTSLVSTRLPA